MRMSIAMRRGRPKFFEVVTLLTERSICRWLAPLPKIEFINFPPFSQHLPRLGLCMRSYNPAPMRPNSLHVFYDSCTLRYRRPVPNPQWLVFPH